VRRYGQDWFLLAVTVVLLISASACSNDAAPTSSSAAPDPDAGTAQRLDAAIGQAMKDASVPGAIIGIWGPDGQYVRAMGVADKATGAPMKTDFYSRIGSVTKTFTVTGVLQLADQGKMALDDPIGRYIDGVPQGDKITIRMLARMQSGLANYSASPAFQKAFGPRSTFTPQQLLGFAFAEPAVFAPGQGFQYSNTNTVLLGLVVEKLSGQTLPDYIRDHILTPLGLTHTSFPATNAFPDPHAQGYTRATPDDSVVTATDWDPSWGGAAGAMISNLEDMRGWAAALATGKLLTPGMQAQRLQTVGSPGQDGYGLGIFNLGGWIGHNGSLPGYQTVTVYLPEKQTTLVILTNTDIEYQGSAPSTTLATAITKIVSPDHIYAFAATTAPR
jgi:D-alanyl-D-alanine carboxypeptidase